jgi:TrmH family RNA methyltransferase
MSKQKIFDSIRVVLVEPTHPGNIGAVARAMKTMGLSRLHLVRPREFPSAEATSRAAGADGVLFEATVHDDFLSAIAPCGWVVGSSARARSLSVEELSPPVCIERLLGKAATTQVALVFGRESSGLSNEELQHCHAVVTIPTDPSFTSLNIAAAVQVLGYEIRRSAQGCANPPANEDAVPKPAPVEDMERFYRDLETTLIEIGYLDPAAPRLLMRRLRRLFSRANPGPSELNILMGVLSAARSASHRKSKTSAVESPS